MSKVRIDNFEIETLLSKPILLDFHCEMGQNQHGACYMKFQCASDIKDADYIFQNNRIAVMEMDDCDGRNCRPFFLGTVNDIKAEYSDENVYVEVRGVTNSMELDITHRQRSFQDIEMTYYEVAREVIGNYAKAGIIWNLDKEKKLERPLIQYNETDWEFLLRLASHFHAGIFVDETQEEPVLYFGLKETTKCDIIKCTSWECGISPAYFMQKDWKDETEKENYIYYVFKERTDRQLGDCINVCTTGFLYKL